MKTSRNQFGLKALSLAILIVLLVSLYPRQVALAETIVGSNVTQDTTWGGDTYRVTKAISVNSGVRLTIAPGTIVKFDENAGIDVYGQLRSLGDPGNEVVFTSDLAYNGAWRGLRFYYDGVPRGPNEISYTVIEYGGSLGGSVSTDNATVAIDHTLIRAGSADGVHGYAGGGATVLDTTIEDHLGYALYFIDPQVDPVLGGLQATGNGYNAIGLVGGGGNMGGGALWENAGLPYEIQGTGFTVAAGETLTVEAGVTMRFSQNSTLYVAGRLIAVGAPEQPITFSATSPTPGYWEGLNIIGSFASPAMAVISHAILEYGGSGPSGGNLRVENARASVQYSRIQYGAAYGVHISASGVPVISYSQITDNALGGVKNLMTAIQVSALNNWWGDPSGPYHPTTNPDGLGDSVSDNVLYDPWLTSALEAGPGATNPVGLQVEVIGRSNFAPGSRQTYAIAYRNNTISTINSAVLVAFLPDFATYINNEGNGYFWFSRNQVYWRLGNLLPGASDIVAVTVEYAWGIPFGTRDSLLAALAGSNAANDLINVQDYLTYTPPTVTSQQELTQGEVDALRAANAELNQLYNAALAGGFVWTDAVAETRSDGSQITMVNLLRLQPPLGHQTIYVAPDGVSTRIADRDSYRLGSTSDTLLYDPQTEDWRSLGGGQISLAGVSAPGECSSTYGDCMKNCIQKTLRSNIADKLIPLMGISESISDCVAAKNGDSEALVKCSKNVFKKIPGYEEGVDLGLCNVQCKADPCSNVCKEDKYDCDNDSFPYGWAGIGTIVKSECNTDTGIYYATTSNKICAIGEKCVYNADGTPSCRSCSTAAASSNLNVQTEFALVSGDAPSEEGASSGGCSECSPAQDPNAKLAVEGQVAPGQELTYTIQYENVGAGEAFGVFVVDRLAPEFDETSLVLGANGRYLPATRTIIWEVGTLAPVGEPGSQGEFDFSVSLRGDLTAGAVVTNQATVYFPSVPEITPTNAVANIVQPLAGVDKELETLAGVPLAITLSGNSASGGALTYAVVEETFFGALSGAPPALTYTPDPGFTGQDSLRFTVSHGSQTSQSARVAIHVLPNPNDKTPPQLTGSSPANGGSVRISNQPRGQDDQGILYSPAIRADFSEVIGAGSLTAAAVTLTGPGGVSVPISVLSDPATRAVWVMPRQPLSSASYTLRLAPPLADEVGNVITKTYTITFGTVNISSGPVYLPFIRR
jgi:uncharacterized repeat protein (TIGR01451 family)